jgi:AAA15 family ATPase/GTPase
MLRDLTIQNYRTLKDFHIDGLARVNLLVGMNNTGKTSLLEAIYLLVNQGEVNCLLEIINKRLERNFDKTILSESLLSADHLIHFFHNHEFTENKTITIQSNVDGETSVKIQPVTQAYSSPVFEIIFSNSEHNIHKNKLIGNNVNVNRLAADVLRLSNLSWPIPITAGVPSNISLQSIFTNTINISFEELALLWYNIALTPKEDRVLESLKILEPKIERFNFTSRQTSSSGIILKIQGQNKPIPLESMGEGMRRIFTLAMAAVTVENGFLLIDEIEAGLHYETQTEMWHFVMEVAQQLNVQVFATTHSWDCIVAFQEALEQAEDSSIGKLFRLSRKDDNIKAVEYTPDELSIAVRQSIEVR